MMGNILDKDEHPRIGLKMSDLEKLKTVFKDNGTVTPGNSSGINDGAAALLLTSLEEAEKKSIKTISKNCIMVFCWSRSIINGFRTYRGCS